MSSSGSVEKRRKVYVAGFSSRDDEHDIKKAFKKYGKIEEVSWKGKFCFVIFRDSKDAERAIRKLHKEQLHGHSLTVEFARSRGANDGQCYNCNKKGHFARDCPKRRKVSSSSSNSSKPKKSKKNKKKASSSSSSNSENGKEKSRSRSDSKSKSKASKSKSKSKSKKSKSAEKAAKAETSSKSSKSSSQSKEGKKK